MLQKQTKTKKLRAEICSSDPKLFLQSLRLLELLVNQLLLVDLRDVRSGHIVLGFLESKADLPSRPRLNYQHQIQCLDNTQNPITHAL